MSRPDLTTPEGVRAYRAELFRVARGWRWAGLAVVTLSAVGLVMVARYDLPWSSVPGRATLAGMVIGWGLVIIGVFARTRYHKRRMSEAE
jgi:membrane protein YdbS with pleckstrin-like domain